MRIETPSICGTGQRSVESTAKPHPPCPLGVYVENVGTEKVPKARLCALGFQDPRLTTLLKSSPTLTSDGESAILQWIVNEDTCWRVEV